MGNEVVGIWGISEEKEAEFIKPPVVELNKKIRECLLSFMDEKLVDLLQGLMDDDVDLDVKSKMLSEYMQERFVDPLTEQLNKKAAERFGGFSWMKNQLTRII